MAYLPRVPEDLTLLWQDRSFSYGNDHALIEELVRVYEGALPAEFNDYFHPDQHRHIVNMIRLAWDDLATMAGKEFPVYVDPDNQTPTAKARAEHQEQIAYGYNRAGRVVGATSMKLLMKVLAWWLVGTANAVLMALPDFKHKTPYFTFRDPRTHFPPVGWSPYTQAAADDALFVYTMTLGELKRRYPEQRDQIAQKVERSVIGPDGRLTKIDDSFNIHVGEYYHADSWMVATLTDKAVGLARSDTGDPGHPDVQPVTSFSLYNATTAKGRSLFADQVSVQAAMARMFSQKLDFFDRTLYPLIFHTPLTGPSIRIGPYATNTFETTSGQNPRVDVVAPAHQVDADQTMAFAMGLSRMLNRNPEQMQGMGDANSAKAINELKSGITATIKDWIWPPVLDALPLAYANAAMMDVNCWGNMRKEARGRRKNEAFSTNYVPAVHLRGREHDFDLEPGLGLAGYQGTLEIMQMLGAELVGEDTALEQLEHVRDVQAEKRRIQSDRLGKLQFADLAAKAQNGELMPGAMWKIKQMVDRGTDLHEAVAKLEESGELLAPPPDMGAMAAAMGGAPGGPPGAPPGGMPGPENFGAGTAPAASMLPMPTMFALRGGPGPRKRAV